MSSVPGPRTPCSNSSRARGDDNAATAARVDVWILLEVPTAWGRSALPDEALSAEARLALERIKQAYERSRILFIRRRVEPQASVMFMLVRSAPMARVTRIELPSLAALAELSVEQIDTTVSTGSRPIVLVCTHGQHDSCCGKRGYPLYDALRQHEALDVWQCTHIGGDRFAANALVLPAGEYYGPVEPREAETFAASIRTDEVFLSGFRGRSTLSRPAQAAENHIRKQELITGREQLRFVKRENLDNGAVRIEFRDVVKRASHSVMVGLYTATSAALATCSSREESPIQQFRVLEHRRTE